VVRFPWSEATDNNGIYGKIAVQYGCSCMSQGKSYGCVEIFKRGQSGIPVCAVDTHGLKYVSKQFNQRTWDNQEKSHISIRLGKEGCKMVLRPNRILYSCSIMDIFEHCSKRMENQGDCVQKTKYVWELMSTIMSRFITKLHFNLLFSFP
jgi:hypothetical protein